MAYNSYTVVTNTSGLPANIEPWPPTTGFGTVSSDQVQQQSSMLSIYNGAGSNKKINIKNINITEQATRGIATGWLPGRFYRLTSMSGGTNVNFIKCDQNASSLPSQVIVREFPTTTGLNGSISHHFPLVPLLLNTRNTLSSRCLIGGNFMHTLSPSNLLSQYQSTNIQPHTLREGEGLLLTFPGIFSVVMPMTLELWIAVSTGGNTYILRHTLVVGNRAELFGIFNGSGSGVTLTIDRWDVSEIVTDEAVSSFSVEPVSYTYGGTSVEPISHDSNNSALPSSIEIKQGAAVLQFGPDIHTSRFPRFASSRFSSQNTTIKKSNFVPYGMNFSQTGLFMLHGRSENVMQRGDYTIDNYFTLSEEQGLCIKQITNTSQYGKVYNIAINFFVEDVLPQVNIIINRRRLVR